MDLVQTWLAQNWWWLLPLAGAVALPFVRIRLLPQRVMKTGLKMTVARFGGTALAFLGAYALVDLAKHALAGPTDMPISTFILGAGLMVLGAGWLMYGQSGYRGGAYAAFGAIFIYAAAFNLAALVDKAMVGPVRDLAIDLTAIGLFAVGGGLLLKAGHDRHVRSLGKAV